MLSVLHNWKKSTDLLCYFIVCSYLFFLVFVMLYTNRAKTKAKELSKVVLLTA